MEALKQNTVSGVTDFFWNQDDWFLFARDYLRMHLNSDDSIQDIVRWVVDFFEKPYKWEEEFRQWQYERKTNVI